MLAYGYQLNLGANVQLATGGAGCQAVVGAVVGPFRTAVLLRIWLTDFTPPGPYTFYSDGNHATMAGTNPFLVSIRDSFLGTIWTDRSVHVTAGRRQPERSRHHRLTTPSRGGPLRWASPVTPREPTSGTGCAPTAKQVLFRLIQPPSLSAGT